MKFYQKLIFTNFLSMKLLTLLLGIINNYNIEPLKQNFYKNIFVLGDSLSDTGAFANFQGKRKITYVMKENPPIVCGGYTSMPLTSWDKRCTDRIDGWTPRKMDTPFYRNSFSNGPVAVQLLANHLGITNFTPGWYDDYYEISKVGYNYATGTAKILTSDDLLGVFSESKAVIKSSALESDRYSLIKQVAALKKHHKVITPNDLAIITIGSNDIIEIIEGILNAIFEETKKVLEDRIKMVTAVLFSQIEELVDYGFERIVVSNMPSLNLVPRFSQDSEKIIAKQIVDRYNRWFNARAKPTRLNNKLKNKLKIFNIQQALQDILENYEKNHMITQESAVVIDWEANYFLQGRYVPYFIGNANERNLNNYAFFDDIHPSARMHQDISDILFKLVSDW